MTKCKQVFLWDTLPYTVLGIVILKEQKFSSAEIEWFIHATEDEKKVAKRIVELFSLNEGIIERSNLEGHFGNPILLCKIRLIGVEADRFAFTLFSSMSKIDRQKIIDELVKHLDEHGIFYLRIDKQNIFESRVALSESEVFRVRLKPRKSLKTTEKISLYRRFLEWDL